TVANATGTMADPDAAVTNIDITCTTNTYGAAGNLVGLSSGTVQLTLDSTNDETISVSANGAFTFTAVNPDGAAYTVFVAAQPAGQVCSVENASGVFHGADVAVTVNCTAQNGTGSAIGGTAAGIVATEQPLQLINIENGDIITLTANGAYTFPALV